MLMCLACLQKYAGKQETDAADPPKFDSFEDEWASLPPEFKAKAAMLQARNGPGSLA